MSPRFSFPLVLVGSLLGVAANGPGFPAALAVLALIVFAAGLWAGRALVRPAALVALVVGLQVSITAVFALDAFVPAVLLGSVLWLAGLVQALVDLWGAPADVGGTYKPSPAGRPVRNADDHDRFEPLPRD